MPAPTGCVRKFKALIVLLTLFSIVLSLDSGWASLLSRVTLQSQKLTTKKSRSLFIFWFVPRHVPRGGAFFSQFLACVRKLLALHLPDAGFHTHTVPCFTSQARFSFFVPTIFLLCLQVFF